MAPCSINEPNLEAAHVPSRIIRRSLLTILEHNAQGVLRDVAAVNTERQQMLNVAFALFQVGWRTAKQSSMNNTGTSHTARIDSTNQQHHTQQMPNVSFVWF